MSVYDLVLDGSKIGYWPDRIAAWERGEKIAPVTIDCAMTRACNAACSFCYAQLQANEGAKISKQCFLDFLDDAAAIGVKGVSFISDGESTVVPWWADAVEHAASVGLKVGAGSNGIKLTKPILEKSLRFLSYLRFNFSAGERKRWAEIMGVPQPQFDVVVQNIRDAVEIKRRDGLLVNLNMQMVVMPEFGDQILPLARLAKELRVDYLIFKHCADDRDGTLGVDYHKYDALYDTFKEAESLSDETFRVAVKWSRLKDEGKRRYGRCFGAPFLMQISGSGCVSTCGFHFNERFKKFHIGNITEKRFKDIWASDRYDEVMRYVSSEQFCPQTRCGPNCLQTKVNEFLWDYKNGDVELPTGPPPPHLEFV